MITIATVSSDVRSIMYTSAHKVPITSSGNKCILSPHGNRGIHYSNVHVLF